ncbi:MAG: PD-(D/E)XK nuclease family protein [Candidatus Magasanikbacteria bacterium]
MHRLSPSSLSTFKDCPKCFWFRFNHAQKRPRGPFPSLPGGMDDVIKDYFDKYRDKDSLPPEIDHLDAELAMPKSWMDKWRNWQSSPSYINEDLNVEVIGALDDCLVDGDSYIPFDYKTRGYPPKGNSAKYYGHQLGIYGLLLSENVEESYPVADYGYLFYYYPKEVKEGAVVEFENKLVKLDIDKDRAKELIKDAVECIEGPEPDRHSDCEYCGWYEVVEGV